MGQACEKLSRRCCVSRFLRIIGVRQPPPQHVEERLIQKYGDDSNGTDYDESPQSKDVYPFLLDREIGEWLVFTKFMIILRGPPGSGKSHLAGCIKMHFPTTHICSADNYHLSNANHFEDYRFDSECQEAAHRDCEAEAKLYAGRGVSPLVIDNANMRSYEYRPYTEIARLFDYNVIMVIPRTPWRFDVQSLAEKNVHHFLAETISSMISQFEPIVYPLYYGWCFAGSPSSNSSSSLLLEKADKILPNEVTDKMIKEFHDSFFSALDVPYVRRRLASLCGFDQDVDRDQLVTFWSSAVNPCFGSVSEPCQAVERARPHCTAFFAKYGHAPDASEYAQRSAVREALLGSIHTFNVEGLFITKRTVGLRVHLTDSDQFALWGGLDNELVDGYAPAQSRPRGCRAHVTLALASGVPAAETGFDALRIMDAELAHRPDVCKIDMPDGILREILTSSPADSESLDYTFYYQYSMPKTARLISVDMSLETVHQEFEQIDINHYGFITRADLENYARRTHQNDNFVDKWFEWFEGEHKGIITMEDICTTLGIPMREAYRQKVGETRQMISQGLISAPPEATKVFAAPPVPSSTPPVQKSLMDGVEVLQGNTAPSDIIKSCVRFVKEYPEQLKEEKDMAHFLKVQMERQYYKHWQVVVAGSTIGCMVAHEAKKFIHFRYNNYIYILYFVPDMSSL